MVLEINEKELKKLSFADLKAMNDYVSDLKKASSYLPEPLSTMTFHKLCKINSRLFGEMSDRLNEIFQEKQ